MTKKRKRGMAMLMVIVAMVVLSSFGVLMTTNAVFVQHKVAVSAPGNADSDQIAEYIVAEVKKLSATGREDIYETLVADGGALNSSTEGNPYKTLTVYQNAVTEGESPSDYVLLGNTESGCYAEIYKAKAFKLRVELVFDAENVKIAAWTYVK